MFWRQALFLWIDSILYLVSINPNERKHDSNNMEVLLKITIVFIVRLNCYELNSTLLEHKNIEQSYGRVRKRSANNCSLYSFKNWNQLILKIKNFIFIINIKMIVKIFFIEFWKYKILYYKYDSFEKFYLMKVHKKI